MLCRLADDGWEMYQPPLYYLASALVLDGCGRSVGDADAVYFLRAVNGVIGLLHCWVVLLCLRLLFGGNLQAQAAGLLVAAFLPPNLYLSQYVTNEPLAGFLVTVAIYFCLRVLRAEKAGLWMPIGIGAALGAAMLTKFSVLLALPFFAAGAKPEGGWAEGRSRVPGLAPQRGRGHRRVPDRLRLALRACLGAVRQADRGELGRPIRARGAGNGGMSPVLERAPSTSVSVGP